jgi:hypothetical protein
MARRTPEEVAEARAEAARQDARYARPLRDRAIEAAQRLDKAGARAVFDEQRSLAVIDDLSPDQLRRLGELHRLVEDHPLTLPLAQLLTCRDSGVAWLEAYIQEELWSWAWCAQDFGVSLEDYAKGQPREVVEAIRAETWPSGWVPECARRSA